MINYILAAFIMLVTAAVLFWSWLSAAVNYRASCRIMRKDEKNIGLEWVSSIMALTMIVSFFILKFDTIIVLGVVVLGGLYLNFWRLKKVILVWAFLMAGFWAIVMYYCFITYLFSSPIYLSLAVFSAFMCGKYIGGMVRYTRAKEILTERDKE